MEKRYYTYILTNKREGSLYIGVTSNLIQRIHQHKTKAQKGFTSKYNLSLLVHYEVHCTPYDAISREKQLKNWRRQWKIDLIEQKNPEWKDLFEQIIR